MGLIEFRIHRAIQLIGTQYKACNVTMMETLRGFVDSTSASTKENATLTCI